MAFSVSCPSCGAILKSPAPIPAGKKVKCPKCISTFEVTAQEEETAVRSQPAPPSPAFDEDRPRRRDDDAEDDRPSRRRDEGRDADAAEDDADDGPRRKPKKKGMGVGIMVGLLVGGGVLLVVGCGACGGLGFLGYTLLGRNSIVGTWEPVNANPLGLRATFTFGADGNGRLNVAPLQINFKYRMTGNVLEIESGQVAQNPFGMVNNRPVRFNVTFHNNDEITLASLDRPGPPERFRRVAK